MHAVSQILARIMCPLAAGLLVAAVAVQAAMADADGERAALARIVHELKVIEPLIREAEAQARADASIRMRYDWLRQDLSRIRQGIQAHIDVPRVEPRTFPPLRGDYRQ